MDAADTEDAAGGHVRYLNRELSWLDFNARVLALGRGPGGTAARAGQVPRHLQPEPRRVLPGPGGGPEGAGGGRPRARPAPTAAPRPSSSSRSATGWRSSPAARSARSSTRWCPPWPAVGIRLSGWDELDDDDGKFLVETFEERIFPVLTPLAVDPGHPFPYISNLSLNLAVTVRDPVTGEHALRPGEGAGPAAPLRGHARRRALRAARAGHRRPPRPALPRHGGRVARHLPGDPQRRPHPRGGGGRGPPGGGRDRAAAPAVRPGRAARAGRRHQRGGAGHAPAGAGRGRGGHLPHRGSPGPGWAVGRARARPPRAEGPRRTSASRRPGSTATTSGRSSSACSGRATCSSTTRTTRSGPRWRSSSGRQRSIRTCSPSR